MMSKPTSKVRLNDDTSPLVKEAVRLRSEGLTLREIAKRLGTSRTSVQRWIEHEEGSPRRRGKHPQPKAPKAPSYEETLDRFLSSPIGSGVPQSLLGRR